MERMSIKQAANLSRTYRQMICAGPGLAVWSEAGVVDGPAKLPADSEGNPWTSVLSAPKCAKRSSAQHPLTPASIVALPAHNFWARPQAH